MNADPQPDTRDGRVKTLNAPGKPDPPPNPLGLNRASRRALKRQARKRGLGVTRKRTPGR